MSRPTWKEKLAGLLPAPLALEIQAYETDLLRRRQGELDEKVFAETRLRRGVYGQRYDNGRRHDGRAARAITYPEDLRKGPNTLWDAPGMQRIKIPGGRLTADQMDVLAEVAEDVSLGVLHLTTRQDIQLHFVHIEDTPDLMRRLAAVGVTTREACGNAVRNVTACPLSGVCRTESFDVTPYAEAMAGYLLGHPDAQDFGRKFKIAFSGCRDQACALVSMHDMGFIARTDAAGNRGFETWVGGGLGAVPYEAQLFDPFLPEDELLPLAQAICRVFAQHGEKKNRARARIKFLIARLGLEEFRRLVTLERQALSPDPRWVAFLSDLQAADDRPQHPGAPLSGAGRFPLGFEIWRRTNLGPQRQPGYVTATVMLPLGDLTSPQLRGLAGLARRFTGDTVRITVEQNLLYRWLPEAMAPEFYRGLLDLGLGESGAGTVIDVTSCPGTDTCKLGIASSRGLALALSTRLRERDAAFDEAIGDLRIKVSGCFNSCGQHHVADIGFYGVSRNVGGRTVPHFQVILGGQWAQNAGALGLAVTAVPSKRIPEALFRITDLYRETRERGERFREFIQRVGKERIRELLQDLSAVEAYESAPDLYSDWGDSRTFTIGDLGKGECAGEVVTQVEFGLAASERQVFEAQLELDRGRPAKAADLAYRGMLEATRTLLRFQNGHPVPEGPDELVDVFRSRLCDTGLFHDPYAGAKFAGYLFQAHSERGEERGTHARQRIEEAQLFVEAAHACHARLLEARMPPNGGGR